MVPSLTVSPPGLETAQKLLSITLPPCSTVGMMFFLNAVLVLHRCNRNKTFQKVKVGIFWSTAFFSVSFALLNHEH